MGDGEDIGMLKIGIGKQNCECAAAAGAAHICSCLLKDIRSSPGPAILRRAG